MRHFLLQGLLLLALSVVGEDNVLTEQEKASGWKLLFDGKNTSGWVNRGKNGLTTDLKGWAAENGEFVCQSGGGDAVYSAEQFENFEISIDWKAPAKANSGLFFRMYKIEDFGIARTEIQMIDARYDGVKPDQKSGGLYMIQAPAEGIEMKQDQWNNINLLCDGPKIVCKLNGQETFSIDLRDDQWKQVKGKIKFPLAELPRKGYFILQDHGGKFWFKNIKVRPLAAPK